MKVKRKEKQGIDVEYPCFVAGTGNNQTTALFQGVPGAKKTPWYNDRRAKGPAC